MILLPSPAQLLNDFQYPFSLVRDVLPWDRGAVVLHPVSAFAQLLEKDARPFIEDAVEREEVDQFLMSAIAARPSSEVAQDGFHELMERVVIIDERVRGKRLLARLSETYERCRGRRAQRLCALGVRLCSRDHGTPRGILRGPFH